MVKIVVTKIRDKFYSAQVTGQGPLAVGKSKSKALRNLQKAVEIKEKALQKEINKISYLADKISNLAEKFQDSEG